MSFRENVKRITFGLALVGILAIPLGSLIHFGNQRRVKNCCKIVGYQHPENVETSWRIDDCNNDRIDDYMLYLKDGRKLTYVSNSCRGGYDLRK